MRENFEQGVALILELEGGGTVSRDPDDPGGTTKWGISQRAYPTLKVDEFTM